MASHIKYLSGNFTAATPCSALINQSPLLPELNDVLIFQQDFMQIGTFFVAQPYNTPNPDLITPAYLFDESPRQDIGAGMVRWTRSWVRVPSSYGKAGGTYPYTFPGFATSSAQTSRDPQKRAVAMQITRDFFLCGNLGIYTSWQQIPIIKAFCPYNINQSNLADISDTVGTNVGDGLSDPSGSGSTFDPGTNPSLTQYKALVAAGSPIQVEDAKITNFRGGVYMRELYTVIAQ